MVLSSLWTWAVNHTPLVETGFSSPSFVHLALSALQWTVCMGKFTVCLAGGKFSCLIMSPILKMPMYSFLPFLVFHTDERQVAISRPITKDYCPPLPGYCPGPSSFSSPWTFLSPRVLILALFILLCSNHRLENCHVDPCQSPWLGVEAVGLSFSSVSPSGKENSQLLSIIRSSLSSPN